MHTTNTSPRRASLLARLVRPLVPALALVAAACADSPDGDPVAPGMTPQLDIRDAARGAGTPGFYFLAPIAAALPSYPGTFDGGREPVVEICVWSGSDCVGQPVARFTRTQGTGGRTITVDAATQSYRVDWALGTASPSTVYRIRVLDGIWEQGHADAKKPAPGETPASLKAQGLVPIGNAASFPIRFRMEQNGAPVVTITAPASQTIVPAGTPFTLSGTATDAEEGDLSSSIVWRTNRSIEPLGTGASLQVSLTSGRHEISASVTDARGTTTTTSIIVVASIISAPAQLNVPFGGTASLPITLSEPAPEGGIVLAITSAAPGTASVAQGQVTIPQGARSANATIAGVAPGAATISVANPEYGMAATQVTVTAQLDITTTSVSFAQGRTAEITVQLRSGGNGVAAPAGGLAVHFTSANEGCAIAAPVTIPAGLVSTTATVVYGGTAATPCSTTLTASAPDVAGVSTDVVTANVGAAPSLSLGTARVGAGLQTSVTLTLGAAAPPGGLEVALSSADASRLLLASSASTAGTDGITLTVPAGSTTATVYVQGIAGTTGSVAVTATAPGYSSAAATQVVAPMAVELAGLGSSTTVFSNDIAVYARTGALNTAGTALANYQSVRVGGGALPITFANSNDAVAQLVRTGITGQVLTLDIAEGAGNTPTTAAAGGVAFDPMGAGSTIVVATAPGATPINGSTQTVTVTAPSMSIGETRVGAGLQSSVTLSLAVAAPTDLTVTIANSNPAAVRLSLDDKAPGTDELSFTMLKGQSSRTVYVQGAKGQAGTTATLTASAPGYTSDQGVQTVATAGLELVGVPSSATTFSPNTSFYARTGALNGAGTSISAFQVVQPGAGPIVVTVTNSNAAVAQLARTSETGQNVTVQIAEGANTSPTTVAAGGVAFDPLGAGTTTVAASAPGLTPLTGATQTVTVSAPTISVGSARVGSGLQTSITVSLAVAPPTPVTLDVVNSNPGVLRISSSEGAAGGDALSFVIPANQTSRTVYVQGVRGQVGVATLTASAPGYTSAQAVQTVAPIALELVGMPSSTTTLSLNTAFQVRVGTLSSGGTTFSAYHDVAPGAGPIVATVTNDNASVAQLVRTGTTGQSLQVQIAEGANSSPGTVAAGGIAFDPLGGGTTTVTATAPGIAPFAAASRMVTVNAPALSVGEARVGAGLQTSVTVTLGAPAPASGLELTVASSAPGVLLLSTSAMGAGAGTVTFSLAPGATSATLYVRGVAGTTGTATVTASAPGFTNGTAAHTVAQTVLEFVSLPTSTRASASNTAFYVRTAVLNNAGTSVAHYQNVASGAGALAVTITNGNAAAAQLARTAGTSQSVTLEIAEGAGNTPSTVAAGGVAFAPLAAGSTTVTAVAAAQPSVRSVSQTVTVNP